MNSKVLLETYPEAASAILAHQTEIFRKSLESSDISPEFKEFAQTQELDYETVASFMDINPRGVFDVFDANDVNIIIHVYTEEPPTEFAFSIAQHDYDHDELYPTRKEAEAAALEKAFEILNDKLCQTK